MKKTFAAIIVVSLTSYCAFAQDADQTKQTQTAIEPAAYKNYQEAMNAGLALKEVGDEAKLKHYKLQKENKDAESAEAKKKWLESYEKAFPVFVEAVKLAGDNKQKCRALEAEAQMHFVKSPKESVEIMKQAYAIDPTDGSIAYYLSWMMNEVRMYSESCQVAEEYLKDGNYRKAYAKDMISDNYIRALIAIKRFDDAKKINEELVKINPQLDRSKRITEAEEAASR